MMLNYSGMQLFATGPTVHGCQTIKNYIDPLLEAVKYRQTNLVTPASVRTIFTSLLASRDSLSQENKDIVE